MLREKLSESLKEMMKARNAEGVATLRLILAALKDRDIAARGSGDDKGIDDSAIMQMLQSMIKQRRDSIALYEKGGRQDLADAEAHEIEIIQSFLPRQFDEAETSKAIDSVVVELEASGLKDMGRVMAALREKYAGQMDFGKASAVVKQKLSV